ncbi:MAG: response regulator [Saprospiraceae bacterium]|nr:response regulator [Saprospiraceae bacterium]
MSYKKKTNLVIFADDDADDRLLLQEAFEENDIKCQLEFVEDGVELLGYLQNNATIPSLILLDINMPRKDGTQILKEIKSNVHWKHIPVVMFTTSQSPEDIRKCYDLGANSFIVKPSSFENLINVTNTIGQYWIETVSLYAEPNVY